MKKFIVYIYALCLPVLYCIGMCACQDQLDIDRSEPSDGNLTIKGSLIIPDQAVTVSRGPFGHTPNADLKLTILEFSLGADAANSFLTNVYQAELKSTSGVVNGGVVDFKFTVNASSSPKVLHLMVANDFVSPQFGSVATILPSLTVSSSTAGGREAYWGMVEFPDGLVEVDENGTATLLDEVSEKLTKVPMIRNFAKISVEEHLNNFELLGFDIINAPMSGTIAPWDQSNLKVPELLEGSKMKSYSDIDYSGILPGNALLRNTEAQARNWKATDQNMLSSADRYLYEHPYEEVRRTYLIIHGRYRSGTVDTYGFYKVDIGYWNNGVFTFYNILRNIHYNITITSVSAPGWATVSEAIDGAPFNNLSASTETKDMLSVSDGVNLLTVNDTNHIIVDDNQTIEVLYRYIERIGTDDEAMNNEGAHVVNLETGPDKVIKSFTGPVVFKDEYGVEWAKITLLCNNPTQNVRTQQFQIINGTGLSRTINLTLRRPWQYAYLKDRNGNTSDYQITIGKGISRNFPFEQNQPVPQSISNEAGAELTVYFSLPPELPSTMFPLDFRLEAKYQGIENNKTDNMVVATGPSLFDPEILSLSYIKTVTYDEYSYLYDDDTSTSVNVNKVNTNHIIACRFQTINTVEKGSDAEIMVYCEYFRPNISVTFKRQ